MCACLGSPFYLRSDLHDKYTYNCNWMSLALNRTLYWTAINWDSSEFPRTAFLVLTQRNARIACHLVALGQQPGLCMGSRIPLCQLEGQIISWSVKDLFSMHENCGCERSQFWVSLFWKSKSIMACYVLWFGKWESIGRTSSFRKDCRIICSCHIYDDNYMKKAIWGIVTRHNIWS